MSKLKGALVLVGLLVVVVLSLVQIRKNEKITPTPEENLAQVSVPTTGLVLKYDFTSGLASDTSGNALNGTITGATSTTGVSGTAINFDGVDDGVSLGSPALLDDLGPVTMSFWIKPSGNGYIISKRDTSCSGYWRLANTNGTIGLLNTKGYNANAATTVSNGSWAHVVYTWDGTKNSTGTKIYINGSDQTSLTTAGSQTSDAACNMHLGVRSGTSEFFTGAMDELYIYNRVLSTSEISALYSAASAALPPASPSITLTANPTSVSTGGSTTLSWSATNATSCSAPWTSSTATSGSQSITPAATTTYTVTCTGTGGSSSKNVSVTVTAPVVSGTVVTPTLPLVYMDTTMPTQTGQTINVPLGGSFQTALSNAQPGDTIVLQAGATYKGRFTLPTKSNPNNKWIVIQSSAVGSLPAGKRVNPSQASLMPKLVSDNDFVIDTAQSASYYRFVGVEVTDTGIPSSLAPLFPDGTRGSYNYGLIELGRGGRDTQVSHLPHHIVFDRSYIHAQPKSSSRRGITMNGAHQAAIDSYISDIKEVGADSQAIGGWNGVGPFKIVNNYLEGAGENIIFGGADPSVPNAVSSDLEIRGNHFYKPNSWRAGDPSYAGVPWSVKNLLELKNTERTLIEGNIFDGSWTMAQTGWAILFRSTNQSGACTWCLGRHITFRNNIVRNAGAGINFAPLGNVPTNEPLNKVLVENNILENIGIYPGDKRIYQVLAGVSDVIIRKNTATGVGLSTFLQAESTVTNFDFTNNIATWGQYGLGKSGGVGESILSSVFTGVFNYSGNVYIKPTSQASSYGSIFVTDLASAEATGKGANRATVNQATQYALNGGGTTVYVPPAPAPTPIPAPTLPAPTMSLSATPSSISSGSSATLSWTAANATSCSASWTSSTATSGSQSVSPTATTTYTMTCTGTGGSASGSATVVVATVQAPTSLTVVLPELPRVYVNTTMPIQTGQTIAVNAGGNLQTALNNALPGDTIVLEAGATFTGNFTLPAKSNPNNKWIIVKSSKENLLPPPGVRVRVADAVNMPKIISPNTAATIVFSASSSFYRLIGLEVTGTHASTSATQGTVIDFVSVSSLSQLSHDVVLDRLYVHGTSTGNYRRGVTLNSANTAVIDSYISDIHEVGADSQAIEGWNGPGPFKISNNYLAGSGENVMFGGSDPSIANLVPSDIEISRNYIHKPLSWKVGDPTYAGIHWTVKNLFEIKNAQRVLFEGNILDGSWTDAQAGGAITLKSANQGGSCNWCVGKNITMRRNHIRNVSSGIAIAPYGDAGASSVLEAANSIYTYENVIEVGAQPGDNRGILTLVGTKSLTFERNVVSGTVNSPAFIEGGAPCTFKDNVWKRGLYGVGMSGTTEGTATLNRACGTSGWTWSGMTMVGTANTLYPAGTTWVTSESLAPLAAQIRSNVAAATSGAVSGNWSGYVAPTPIPAPTQPAPTLSLSATPASITSGASSTLSWSTTNTTSCSASWTSSTGTSGSQSVTPTATTTYSMTCTGTGGSATQSTTIVVSTAPAPTPTPTPIPSSTKFQSGDRIQTNALINVRSTGSSLASVLGTQALGSLGTIVSGGTSADGFYWWQVNYDLAPDGWSVETYLDDYVAPTPIPAPTTPPPSTKFALGDTVSTTTLINVRATAGGTILGTQPTGAQGTVIGGPTYVGEGYAWSVNFVNAPDGWAFEEYLQKVTTAPAPTPEPTPEPTPTPTPAPSLSIAVGGYVEVTATQLNIRSSAGGGKIGTQYLGAKGLVTDGPTTIDGIRWWKIDFSTGTDGWASETYLKKSTAATPLALGSAVYTATRVNVRVLPSIYAERVGTQSTGAQGTIVAGPVSANGYTWWQVNFTTGADGWVVAQYLR